MKDTSRQDGEHAGADEMAASQPARRRESKETRREQLIKATISSLAKRGYAATTMADVSDGAKLSRGIVNFHFTSKENLLLETLQFMSDEYAQNWERKLAQSALDTAWKIHALITADLDRRICTPTKVAAWFALMAEAKSRPAYQKLAWERDEKYRRVLRRHFELAKQEAGYSYDPDILAAAVYAMQEGLWLRLMLSGPEYTRETALGVVLQMLGTFFPRHFSPGGAPISVTNQNQKGG